MSSNNNIKSKTVTGFIWRFAERCGAQGIAFVVSIVLARILNPSDYGIIALVTVFTSIIQIFVDSGLGTALVQKKDADDIDFSSVFYFNIFFCILLYLILFLCAPFIAVFYENSDLVSVIRVLGITILVSGMKNIQQAYVSKYMLFKRFFFATIGGTLVSAIVGIWMAYNGFGVWALVAQYLSNVFMDTTILWFSVKWRPKLIFSIRRLKQLYSFGWKLLLSSLIHTLYDNLRQLIIGKMYSSSDLAFFNKGQQFPNMIVVNINSSIDSVLLPAMSTEQNNAENVKSMTRRAIRISSYIMWPLMLGLFVCAESIIRLILTEKWIFAVPYMRIFCIVYAFEPIQTANLNAIKAMGRSDMFLKLEVIKKTFGLMLLFSVMKFGVFAIAVSLIVYTIVASILNSYPNRTLLNYSYFEQIHDIVPYILLSVIMALTVYPITFLNLNDITILAVQIILGVLIYVVGSIMFKLESFQYMLDILKNNLKVM